jgi:hypothetical protein
MIETQSAALFVGTVTAETGTSQQRPHVAFKLHWTGERRGRVGAAAMSNSVSIAEPYRMNRSFILTW